MRWLVAIALLCGVAHARPGGGHSFSGGSHSSYSSHSSSSHYSGGGGGGYSDGEGFTENQIVIGSLVCVVIVLALAIIWSRRQHRAWLATATIDAPPATIDDLLAADPDFSDAVFEDFAYRLYAEAQRARGNPAAIARIAPYLAPDVAAKLSAAHAAVEQVVIGGIHTLGVRQADGVWQIAVQFESNVATKDETFYIVERWFFGRAGGHTKLPATRDWPCPNCGAPWQATEDPRTCAHCGQPIEPGRFDWAVTTMLVDSWDSVGQTLTGTVPEVGNDYPTIVAPDARELAAKLTADDPNVTWPAVETRVAMIYTRLNEGWNASDLTPIRGLVTRSLQDYLRYWLDAYRREGLHNRLDDARIIRFDLAKVVRDRWFDAITVRVFATGHDYTLRGDAIVGGSREAFRDYTEYWTLLRSSARRGPIVTQPACPNCGAPLAISDAGACTHCNAELENGSFDWVLSKIEQDDVYSG